MYIFLWTLIKIIRILHIYIYSFISLLCIHPSPSLSPNINTYDDIFIEWFPSKYDGKVYRYFIHILYMRIILCASVLYYNSVITLALTARTAGRNDQIYSSFVSLLYCVRPLNVYTVHVYIYILCYNTSPVQLSYSNSV